MRSGIISTQSVGGRKYTGKSGKLRPGLRRLRRSFFGVFCILRRLLHVVAIPLGAPAVTAAMGFVRLVFSSTTPGVTTTGGSPARRPLSLPPYRPPQLLLTPPP